MPLRRLCRRLAVFVLAVAPVAASPAFAAGTPLCPQLPPATRAKVAPDTPLFVRADRVTATQAGLSDFTGAVELERGPERLNADALSYDKATDHTDASGNVRFWDLNGDSYQTTELHLTLGTRTGYTGPGSYILGINHARGDAGRLNFEGPDQTRLTDVSYTSCPSGQDDWFFNVKELQLDNSSEIGTARDAWFSFKGVPLFYFPYISFPLSDQRKSGFLMPYVGYASNSGMTLATPYYFNLAPNYDDTFTPRVYSQRGLQLRNEFRYLTHASEGSLQLEALPNDHKYGADRSAGSLTDVSYFSPLWSANVNVNAVSDQQYLTDFGDRLIVTSQTHLPQIAEMNYQGMEWNFKARAAHYQTVDPTIPSTDRPYSRLPQLLLATNPLTIPNRFNYQIESELVRFERSDSLDGERVSLYPSVSLPLTASYGYITPRVGVHHIAYDLQRPDNSTQSLTRGVYSLDSGLVFERDTGWFGSGSTQTLEPRLYYLYVPYKGQDDLPNFDTSVPDFSFSNLFRDNRFIGGDRVGDANQLTAAVTSRFLEGDSGAERLRVSIGRIQYFEDRRVNLPGGAVSDRKSDLVAETTARLPGNWYARGGLQWNRDFTAKSNVYFQYNPDNFRIVNLGQRYIQNDIKQTDISAEWPVAGRWTFRGRSLYSERDRRNVDSYAGFQYNACCWAARVLLSRRYSTTDGQVNAILFEFELNGLGKFGGVPASPLQETMFAFPPGTQR